MLPALTWAPGANMMPAGLTRKICPLAESEPKIALGSPPVTRFSATEPEPG